MPGPQRQRSVLVFARVALATSLAACTVRGAPRTTALSDVAAIRFESSTAFVVGAPLGSMMGAEQCRATMIEGHVARVVGDTVLLDQIYRVRAAPDSAGRARCPDLEIAAFVRTPETAVTTAHVSGTRTVLLLVGIVAAFLAFAAYGASQIEYDY